MTAARTVHTTVTAAGTASPSMNRRPTESSPSSAMQTVPPAKSTARPEVFKACTTDCSGSIPDRRPRRCLVTMNRA
ncbi:hypothetical protein [Streptacidiphilus rugosus]|uniref:hypothetical protein n=1 Tax=Streptacidiphilus rugosus TaxID=405783 RepID=UPI001E594212|nr:hypothetical protein [Streptacidiphilus rugosus]